MNPNYSESEKQAYRWKRANQALNAAISLAERERHRSGNWSLSNRMDEIQLYQASAPESCYAEPGYDHHSLTLGQGQLAATGNWNSVSEYNRVLQMRKTVPQGNLPKRLLAILEKLGFKCEWSDEWTSCDDCSKLIRTQPDSHWWEPSYVMGDGSCRCKGCAPKEEEEPEEESEEEEDSEEESEED